MKDFKIQVLLFLFCCQYSYAAKVDTVNTYSASMKMNVKAVVITPDKYDVHQKYPVLYMLHGYGGNYADYVNVFPVIKKLADDYAMMIVCADGKTSWYFDSPVNPALKYDTYVSSELVSWIDQHYATINNKAGRAIMGLSMGGHGALYLAFKHPDVYGAAGSMSGGVDIRPFPNNWDITKTLGDIKAQPANWEKYTVTNMIGLLKADHPALLIDCGTKDFFYKVNLEFHNKLLESNIAHDFIVRDGGHDVDYWSNSINYQLLFMHLYFMKTVK